MIKVFILVVGSLLQQAEGPMGQSKMFLQTTLEECQKNEKGINAMPPQQGVEFRAKCIEFDFDNLGERTATK